jgi:hypothetical protein
MRVDLQVQAFGHDHRNEQIVDVQAVPTEHAAGTGRPQGSEELEAVLHNRGADHNLEPAWINPIAPLCARS